jgi:hypothetical protein
MPLRRTLLIALLITGLGLGGVPAAADSVHSAAKKRKPPCGFKLARNKKHHDRVRMTMTCHRKLVVNIRFTFRKKYNVNGFTGFPGAQCSIQSAHVAGCIYGNGAPLNKAVTAVVSVAPPAAKHDKQFVNVQVFISGSHDYTEVLAY